MSRHDLQTDNRGLPGKRALDAVVEERSHLKLRCMQVRDGCAHCTSDESSRFGVKTRGSEPKETSQIRVISKYSTWSSVLKRIKLGYSIQVNYISFDIVFHLDAVTSAVVQEYERWYPSANSSSMHI